MSKSYDVIGSKEKSVAIVEIREDEKGREKDIAEAIMSQYKNVKSVISKGSSRQGEFRTREYKVIAGDKDTEVLHKEHGYSIRIDPTKSYFSSREGTERQRIAKQIEPNQTIMMMFAGVGPYAIAIAKAQPDVKKVIAVEINPDAVEYMRHNIRINKLSHKIKPVLGDVRSSCKSWYDKCDHVIMPLPLSAEEFLDIAVACLAKDGIIHFYSHGNKADGDIFAAAISKIDERLKKLSIEYKIIDKRIVLPYAPGQFKVCIEFKVDKK
jgi:tRNA (guanine37-N1)-methyltransferase